MTRLRTLLTAVALLASGVALACTNFIVTRGASTDGSIIVSYAADSHQLYGALYKYNAPKKGYPKGTYTIYSISRYRGIHITMPDMADIRESSVAPPSKLSISKSG